MTADFLLGKYEIYTGGAIWENINGTMREKFQKIQREVPWPQSLYIQRVTYIKHFLMQLFDTKTFIYKNFPCLNFS